MTTFELTDEQRLFRDTMRTFVDERIAPNAAEADRTSSFPWKSFEACRELELPALSSAVGTVAVPVSEAWMLRVPV